MNTISVIIPVWNRADIVIKAIYSALNQTIPPMEIIVCDDGSTDNIIETVHEINDSRVKFIGADHSGLPAIPRNRGINESKGNWLAFLDSDDEWLPRKLEVQLEMAKKLNCKAVCSNAFRKIKGIKNKDNLVTWKSDRITFDDLLTVNHIVCSSVLIHKSILTNNCRFPESENLRSIEDYAFWIRLATQTDFAFINKPLLIYSDDASDSIRRLGVEASMQQKIVFSDFINWSKSNSIPNHFINKARKKYLTTLLRTPQTNISNFFQHLKK